MTLTWKEFLNLAAVVQILNEPIYNFFKKLIDINELNRRVAKAAQNYLALFKDAKYIEFTNTIRIGSNYYHLNIIYLILYIKYY